MGIELLVLSICMVLLILYILYLEGMCVRYKRKNEVLRELLKWEKEKQKKSMEKLGSLLK